MKIVRPNYVSDAVLASSNVPETEYTVYNSGTTYAKGDRVRYIATDWHKVYESVQASNTSHSLLDDLWWIEIGETNRWRMFDQSVQSQTTHPDEIDVELEFTGRIDTVVLLNVSGASAQIVMTDAVDGVVYDETHSLVADSGILDWWAYFFEPIVRKTDLAVMNLPPYANPTLEVMVTNTGDDAAVGVLVVGLSKDIGGTQWSPSIGIQDYSVKERDPYGNINIVERAYSRRASFSIWVPAGLVDELQRLLADLRATPIVYIGDEDYASSIIYGFYRDFDVTIAYPKYSNCTLELEGLT